MCLTKLLKFQLIRLKLVKCALSNVSGGKKKQLHVDKPDNAVVDAYDALDDFDFM